jgi:hypothetical protein
MFVTAGLATQITVWSIVVHKLISTAHSHKDSYYNITISIIYTAVGTERVVLLRVGK